MNLFFFFKFGEVQDYFEKFGLKGQTWSRAGGVMQVAAEWSNKISNFAREKPEHFLACRCPLLGSHFFFFFFFLKKCDLNINKTVILKVLEGGVNSLLSFIHLETFIYATCLISADILEHWHFQCMFLEFEWTNRQKEIVSNSSRKAIYSIVNRMNTGILKQLWNSLSPCLHLIFVP